jgi:hypothetical protein
MLHALQYEIEIEGRLNQAWTDWFEGCELRYEDGPASEKGRTVLSLSAVDPAHLHGVLAQIGALNLNLVQVRRIHD